MLRAMIGSVYGRAVERGGGETAQPGLAYTFSVDAGATLVENLVLHGRLSAIGVLSANWEGAEDAYLTQSKAYAVLIGPAVTYYFLMPLRLYATAAVGPAWFF